MSKKSKLKKKEGNYERICKNTKLTEVNNNERKE